MGFVVGRLPSPGGALHAGGAIGVGVIGSVVVCAVMRQCVRTIEPPTPLRTTSASNCCILIASHLLQSPVSVAFVTIEFVSMSANV